MAKVRDYHKLALDIIDVVGGQKNIVNATRCATRLRLVLKETPEGAKEKVSALAGVITVVENNGQFQVVIGTHVGEVYDSVAEALHLDASAQEIEQPKQNIVNRIIATMSAVFAPFVYILAAAGLLQGALILITMAAPSCHGRHLHFYQSSLRSLHQSILNVIHTLQSYAAVHWLTSHGQISQQESQMVMW